MGLYLCVFRGDEELEGLEIGSYQDFGVFRDTVRDRLERGNLGSRFPILMRHSDSDGSWTPTEASELVGELQAIAEEFARLPPEPIPAGWQREVVRALRLSPTNLRECFFDVDGEPLLDRLAGLCRCSMEHGLPILFQ